MRWQTRMLWFCLLATAAACGQKPMPRQKAEQRIAEMGSSWRDQNAEMLNEEGLRACQEKNYNKAVNLFQRAVQIRPDVAIFRNNLGRCWYWLGEYDLAIAELREAIRLDPNDAGAYANMGDVYRQRENYDEALRMYQEALERDPNLGRVHYEVGNLYLKRNQFAIAESRLKKALELDPGNNRALLARAILYHLTHRDELAWQDIQELRKRGFEVNEDLRAAVLDGMQEKKNKKRFRPGD